MEANVTREPGLTEKMVDDSVLQFLENIGPSLPEIERMIDAILEVSETPMPNDQKHYRTFQLLQVIEGKIKDHVPCGKGCNHCCHMSVSVSSVEAEIIRRKTGVKPRSFPLRIMSQDQFVARFAKVRCPFLGEDGACQIYDVRPIACRTHYNLSKYPSVCDIVNYSGQKVANLNFSPVWDAQLGMSNNFDFGDIRDYFPKGLNT